ncbi:Alpha-2-macroglobulin [Chelonia mydas]|uniref:Alpha-2-macroglobulin n=1 Tax=Chelonia mydas TaxID=8469 RepID=M7BV24_CHEMY|nr:Alpha-2-macroglobulin [Chelonia mydas]
MGKDRLPGGPNIFLLLLFLLPGDTSPTTEPQYMVLVPFLIHTNVPEKVCIQLTHLNESVTLSATLEYTGENRSLIADVVSEKDVFKCVPFTLPKSNSSAAAFLTVLVKGPTLEFRSRKSVLVKNSKSLVFVQTDKPIYKPGQTVLFRVVYLDENFHPLNRLVPLAYIEDPKRNRLYQWQEVELKGGFTQLSFPLSSEPIQGTYKVVVQKGSGDKVQHPFTVKEYVLPKFEVLVKLPKMISILEEKLKVTVCGLYTFGKPVPGLVNFRVCRKYNHPGTSCYGEDAKAVCEEFSGQADSHGCISEVVKTKIFQLRRAGYEDKIHVEANIKEEETGVELTGTGSCKLTSIISKVTFEKATHKTGTYCYDRSWTSPSYELGYFRAKRFYSSSNSFLKIELVSETLSCGHTQEVRATHKTGTYCYDRSWTSPSYELGYFRAKRFYSSSNSFLKIELVSETLNCGHTQEVRVHYILKPEAVGEQKEIVFYYLVMAKGGIVRAGTQALAVEHGDVNGTFSLMLPVESDIAPLAQMLIYTTSPSQEPIADSVKFQVENCFANKVNLHFSPAEGLPASDTHLRVGASPGSLCAVRAVDKSVLLMKPEAELSPSSVYNLLPVKELQGYHHGTDVLPMDPQEECIAAEKIIVNGVTYAPVSEPDEEDTYSILKSCLAAPLPFRSRAPDTALPMPLSPALQPLASPVLFKCSNGSAELPLTIPDTITEWKANMFCTSSDTGFGLSPTVSLRAFQPFFVELTLPYSVVRGEAFTLKATVFNYLTRCIRVNISLAPSADFRATPVEKEEDSYCLCANGRKTVSWAVTPKSLGNVNFSVSAEALKTELSCGNEVAVLPETGRKDTVIKQLLVEDFRAHQELLKRVAASLHLQAEEMEEPSDSLFNVLSLSASGNSEAGKISLKLPPNVVEGSARAYVTVLGDILGTAMQNLQQLLQMPFGCGEQNMVLFAPNIYVLDYLNKTGQLSEETKSKAIGYLVSGYQRQLNYKHLDGSYSTFGEHFREPGNTWLTAFVLKSFAQARSHIFIEEKHIQDALAWLAGKQKDNGCFRSSGMLLNNAIKVMYPPSRLPMGLIQDSSAIERAATSHGNSSDTSAHGTRVGGAGDDMGLGTTMEIRMGRYCTVRGTYYGEEKGGGRSMGGVDDEVTLSAYITIALLEIPLPITHSVVRSALFCLETATDQGGKHVYTKALMAYAFTLARKEEKRRALLDSLDKEAVKEDGSVHWQRPRKQPEADLPFYHPRAPSAEVEMTSYVLLAYLTAQPAPSQGDLSLAAQIAKWISKQQNPNGGFSSTQDTVVALQALSRYGASTYTKSGGASTVTLQSTGNFQAQFQVDHTNRLLLQRMALPEVPGDYSMGVTGEGCVYVQTSLRYNVLPKPEEAPFALEVHAVPETCDSPQVYRTFSITINISYTGKRPVSNMVIVDVKMLSGFIPVKSSVRKLEGRHHIHRTELSTNHVLLYMEQVSNVTQSFSFAVEQDFPVQSLKPAVVKVYDYYETDEFAIAEYSAPCSKGRTGHMPLIKSFSNSLLVDPVGLIPIASHWFYTTVIPLTSDVWLDLQLV